MKLKKIMRVFIFTFIVLCVNCLICVDVNANTNACSKQNPCHCNEKENDRIVKYFGFNTTYDGNDTVKLTVTNGSFSVIKFTDTDNIVIPKPKTENKPFSHYVFNHNVSVIDNKNPLILKINPDGLDGKEGIIKLKLVYYTGNDGVIDSSGCNSYEYKGQKGKKTFVVGKDDTIEIRIPKAKNINQDKYVKTEENEIYGTYCAALNGDYSSKADFIKKYDKKKKFVGEISKIDLHENSADAKKFYEQLVPDCFEQKTYAHPSDSKKYKKQVEEYQGYFISMVNSALEAYHYKSTYYSSSISDKDESWSIKFKTIKDSAVKYYASKQDSDGVNQKSTFYELIGADETAKPGKKINESTEFSLTCDYKSAADMHVKDSSGKMVYNLDANTKTYYAINTKNKSLKYTHQYNGNGSKVYTDSSVPVCESRCEEAVEVKYGPPVASKAGLCFEYQVQVTSRVKCTSKIHEESRPGKGTYESPYPWCNEFSGYQHQGGPTDSYEACISDCDGGKYTKACSEKCYKSVYGSQSNKTSYDTDSVTADKLAFNKTWNQLCKSNDGKYVRSSTGDVTWKSLNSSNACGYSRYYYQVEPDRTYGDHGNSVGKYYFANSGGFKRHIISSTELCGDACSYHGYTNKSYLNAPEMFRDYKDNLNKYKNAIKECSMSAKCTTKTAKFSIKADYYTKNDSGDRVKNSTNFSSRRLDSKGNSDCSNAKAPASGNILLNYEGCYKKCGQGLQYHARWSFPGTWLNYKTGKMSYEVPSNKSAWFEIPEKFCTPRDALSTNDNWWKYYVNQKKGELAKADIDDEYLKGYSDMCKNDVSSVTKYEQIGKIDWNISASTELFGYFGWHFDIKCFYALNKCDALGDYAIRTVDTKNLFPASDGSDKMTYQNGTAKTGRETGFNWSSGAVSTKNSKNEATGKVGYTMNPPKLISQIQDIANRGATYNDEYLDYQFVLDKNKLAKLRKIYAGLDQKMFTNGKDIYPSENGVARYYSYIIHGGGGLEKFAKASPSTSAIFCNNMVNYNSKECNNYDK